jgi:hypothetical protein
LTNAESATIIINSDFIIIVRSMAKATIKSKSGALITVEGSDSEVSNILSVFERTSAVGQAKEAANRRQSTRKDNKKRQGASDLVIDLKENGFFDKPKGLGEISKALEEKGFLYPLTTLSGVVLGLVQKRQLRRKKLGKKWAYGK